LLLLLLLLLLLPGWAKVGALRVTEMLLLLLLLVVVLPLPLVKLLLLLLLLVGSTPQARHHLQDAGYMAHSACHTDSPAPRMPAQ
jgi:hypothetical protein